MGTARKVLSNTVAQIVGQAIVAILGAVLIKVLTQYLGASLYGEYAFIYEFLAFFSIIADFGLFAIAVREMSKDETQKARIVGNVLGLRSTLLAITMPLAIFVIFLVPNIAGEAEGGFVQIGVAIASLTAILTLLNGTIASVIQIHLKMHIIALSQVVGKIISVGSMLMIALYILPNNPEKAFYYLIWAGVAGALIMLLISYTYSRRLTNVRPRFEWSFWKNIMKKTAPYGIALILHTFYLRLDYLMIYFIKGNHEVGIYSVGMKILELLSMLPLFFMNAVLPSLTRHIKERTEKFKKIIQLSFDFLAMIGLPILIGGFVLAYPIIYLISDESFLSNLAVGFYGSDIAMQILVFAIFFNFLSQLFGYTLIASDNQIKMLWVNLGCIIFKLIGDLIFVPIYGFRGAAVVSAVAAFVMLGGYYYFSEKYLQFRPSLKPFLKILTSGLIMGVVVTYLRDPLGEMFGNKSIIILVPLGAVVYGIALLITRGLNKEVLKLVLKK